MGFESVTQAARTKKYQYSQQESDWLKNHLSHVSTRLKIHQRISIKERIVDSNFLMHRCILTADVFKSSELK